MKKTYLLPCGNNCGQMVERTNNVSFVTCFPCKSARKKALANIQYQDLLRKTERRRLRIQKIKEEKRLDIIKKKEKQKLLKKQDKKIAWLQGVRVGRAIKYPPAYYPKNYDKNKKEESK